MALLMSGDMNMGGKGTQTFGKFVIARPLYCNDAADTCYRLHCP